MTLSSHLRFTATLFLLHLFRLAAPKVMVAKPVTYPSSGSVKSNPIKFNFPESEDLTIEVSQLGNKQDILPVTIFMYETKTSDIKGEDFAFGLLKVVWDKASCYVEIEESGIGSTAKNLPMLSYDLEYDTFALAFGRDDDEQKILNVYWNRIFMTSFSINTDPTVVDQVDFMYGTGNDLFVTVMHGEFPPEEKKSADSETDSTGGRDVVNSSDIGLQHVPILLGVSLLLQLLAC